jgi:hypothetical protein
MKRNTAVSATGVLDNEEDLIKDMDELSLEEARAVLCVLMLCFVLDGSIGKKEQQLWIKMVAKMEAKFGKGKQLPHFLLNFPMESDHFPRQARDRREGNSAQDLLHRQGRQQRRTCGDPDEARSERGLPAVSEQLAGHMRAACRVF